MGEMNWDDWYSEHPQIWSGRPNGALVAEASELHPGRALDVGCGEGADAWWLARRGWQVTGIDISQVALDRAAAAPDGHGVTWARLDLATTAPERGAYDLVSAQYAALPRQDDHAPTRGLVDAVAVGGTLLITNHDLADLPDDHEHGPALANLTRPEELAGLLDDRWTVLVDEIRPRADPAPEGTHHVHDVVLRARRDS